MNKELNIKKCLKCGAVIKSIKDCTCEDCGIACCGKKMHDQVPNSTDASFEKHVPEITIQENQIVAKVNHVMEEDHYIEWIALVADQTEETAYFKPTQEATVAFNYIPNSKVYAYCNKHGLWVKEIN